MNELDLLIDKFSQKENTHPELSRLWINYLQIKKQRINNIISEANHLLRNIENYEDISIQDLTRAYIVNMMLCE